MTEILRLPHLGTADEDVLLSAWLCGEGEPVRKGQPLASVETLKASFEVEAESDGVLLRRLANAGDRVPARAPLAVLGRDGEQVTEDQMRALLDTLPSAADVASAQPTATPAPFTGSSPGRAQVAPAARRRARELGIDPETLQGTGPGGLVRVADVERAHAGGGNAGAAAAGDGVLDPAFLQNLRGDTEAFAALASDFKVALYRRHGARIGEGCHIGPGAALIAERIVLGARAHFGPDCRLVARELVAGELLHFGPRCRIRCTRLELGDNAFFTEDVEIGGGGALEPEAELVVGSHGFVGEHVHVNPCRPVRIGDEVVLSRNAVLMTHSFGASALRGYPSRFAGITIGDGAQIGIGAVLFPGVEVGAGAILLSGSSLVSSVPPGRLFGGVPAVDLKAAATPLSPEQFEQRAREMVIEFGRQLGLRGMAVRSQEQDGKLRLTVREAGRDHVLAFSTGAFEPAPGAAEEVRVAPRFDEAEWQALPAEIAGIDLSVPAFRGAPGPLAEAFREFLRKRGLRLRPRSWAYKGGWL